MQMEEAEWTEPELQHMEAALRCLICGEFYHGPVLLPCSHVFCSECVRRFLQSRGSNGCCPECKQPCTPAELVANRTVERLAASFRKLKPRLLPVLERHPLDGSSEEASEDGGQAPLERMPLVNYSVMKDKEVRKLLEDTGIRVSTTKRDEIIQIHKEFVLLWNAQADSSAPKSVAKLKQEVVRNHQRRQQERFRSTVAKTQSSSAMNATFARLKAEIQQRKDGHSVEQASSVVPDSNDKKRKMEEQETTEESSWECPRCTLLNDASECEACGYKPSAKKSRRQFQSKLGQ